MFEKTCHYLTGCVFSYLHDSSITRTAILLTCKNYLADRKQRVVLSRAASIWKSIEVGEPQGSI